MIRGYPRAVTVRPGQTLTLHISTEQPHFRVEFYRQGATLEHISDAGPFEGVEVPHGPPDEDWGWPAYTFDVPVRWRPGAYVAMLIEIDSDGTEYPPDRSTTFGTSGKALFVVRRAIPGEDASVLYKISTNTFHAYNGTGYGSLYAEATWSRRRPPFGFKVTMRRPGGGAGGEVEPGDPMDAHTPDSRRQTFAHWDAPFIQWLESAGYVLDYCTDVDLHQDADLLTSYPLLLSTGHDEYWTEAMRDHVDTFVANGGNVAYFSGNISHWRIHMTDNDTAIVCAKVAPGPFDTATWQRDNWHLIGNPESRTTGVTSASGGGWWNGPRDALGYTVQHADHWAYAGTDLSEADVFGAGEAHPLLGYEVDGASFRRVHGVAVATGVDGAPREFAILGIANLSERWSAPTSGAVATMGVMATPGGGIVFQGATTDWPIVAPMDDHVGRITRNVLDRLRLRSVRLLGPLPARAGRMLATVGETASFHADLAPLGDGAVTCVWEAAGGELVRSQGPVACVRFPATPSLVSVSVIVERDGKPVAFGTRTLLPLTKTESLQLEATILVREVAMPGDPSGPWVMPTTDPVMHIRDVIPVRLPWMRDRAAQLQETAERLIERLGPDGTRFPDDDEEAQL